MARCCGSTGTCACKIEAGRNVAITGTGTSQDPFVVASNVSLSVEDNTTFDLGLSGAGTLTSPWVLTLRFADGARLTDLPDVDADAPQHGYVLGWNIVSQTWVPQPPTTAAAGGTLTDASLSGDGSSGSVLQVREDPAGYIATRAAGLGLSDTGINSLVRKFADAGTRASATPAPIFGALSMLNDHPGQIDYWDGAAWVPITNGVGLTVQSSELLALSGTYDGGPVTQFITTVSVETGVDGTFDVLSAVDLDTYAGVLSVSVQPMGPVPWVCMVEADVDRVMGTAYRLDTGAPYAGIVVSASVTATLY